MNRHADRTRRKNSVERNKRRRRGARGGEGEVGSLGVGAGPEARLSQALNNEVARGEVKTDLAADREYALN